MLTTMQVSPTLLDLYCIFVYILLYNSVIIFYRMYIIMM